MGRQKEVDFYPSRKESSEESQVSQNTVSFVHAEQHHSHCWGLGSPGLQVWPLICQVCLCSLYMNGAWRKESFLRLPWGHGWLPLSRIMRRLGQIVVGERMRVITCLLQFYTPLSRDRLVSVLEAVHCGPNLSIQVMFLFKKKRKPVSGKPSICRGGFLMLRL